MTQETIIPVEKRLTQLEGHYTDQVMAFRQRLAHIGPEQVLIVLLDVGKNIHWASASTAAGVELVRPHRLPTSQQGLSDFMGQVDHFVREQQPQLVLLGHEPSGVYHETWARALMERYAPHLNGQAKPAFEYKFFNPYQVKLARQQTHLRHRKTDPRDLAAMLDLALRGLGYPAFLATDTELLIRQEVNFIRAQTRLLLRLEQQLRQQLDRLWPGAVVNLKQFQRAHPGMPLPTPLIQTDPFQRERLRVLLAHCPNPYQLKAMSDDQILALYRQHVGRAGPVLLNTLHTWADNAVLPPPDVAAPLAEQLHRLFQQYIHTETLIEEGRGHLIPLVPKTSARHIVPIPGLGEYDAACYMAGVGSIQRFRRAAEVWSFVGYDPIQDGSGDRPDRVGHISKHGDPPFRDSLFQMGFRTALHYAPLTLTFLEAFDRGLSEIEATIHAAHRINRICFHLMLYDEPFENRSTPQLEAEMARRWKLFKAAKKHRKSRRKRGRRRP